MLLAGLVATLSTALYSRCAAAAEGAASCNLPPPAAAAYCCSALTCDRCLCRLSIGRPMLNRLFEALCTPRILLRCTVRRHTVRLTAGCVALNGVDLAISGGVPAVQGAPRPRQTRTHRWRWLQESRRRWRSRGASSSCCCGSCCAAVTTAAASSVSNTSRSSSSSHSSRRDDR